MDDCWKHNTLFSLLHETFFFEEEIDLKAGYLHVVAPDLMALVVVPDLVAHVVVALVVVALVEGQEEEEDLPVSKGVLLDVERDKQAVFS